MPSLYANQTHAEGMFDDFHDSIYNEANANRNLARKDLKLPDSYQVEVASGNNYACQILVSGKAKCWGFEQLGEMKNEPYDNSYDSSVVSAKTLWESTDTDFKDVKSGVDFNCALDDGNDIYCWGHNERGQLGTNTVEKESKAPLKIDTDVKFSKIYTKDHYACALDKDLHAYCWGDGSNGEVGNGQKGYFTSPQKVETDIKFSRLSMSTTFVCGVEDVTNRIYCWGKGVGGTTKNLDSSVPVKI